MLRFLSFILLLFTLFGCLNSNWDLTPHNGEYDNLSINAIHFENADRGVIGGYTLIEDNSAKNDFKLSMIPVVYYTENKGEVWKKVDLHPKTKSQVMGLFLSGNLLLCQTDSGFYESSDFTKDFKLIKKQGAESDTQTISRNSSKCQLNLSTITVNGINYDIKQCYQNDKVIVALCQGKETLTDYYFRSFNKGMSWTFMHKEYVDPGKKYLLGDQFLLRYQFPFGLQRLKIR